MPPSNMSIQTGSSSEPTLKQSDHPEHNMPEPEYDYNNKGRGMLKDAQYGAIMRRRNQGKDSAVSGDDE